MTSQTIKALIAWASKHSTSDLQAARYRHAGGSVFGEKTAGGASDFRAYNHVRGGYARNSDVHPKPPPRLPH